MPPTPEFPYQDGDVTVLGPEIFASNDGQVICWKGQNYVRQPEPTDSPTTVRVCMGPMDVDAVQDVITRQLRKERRNPLSGGA